MIKCWLEKILVQEAVKSTTKAIKSGKIYKNTLLFNVVGWLHLKLYIG